MHEFCDADVRSLASLLDKNVGFKRPDSQVVGYSMQDETPPQDVSAAGTATTAAKAPSAVHIPSTVVDKTIGLPVPSQTKEGRELKRGLEKERPKPEGNSIWTAEELSSVGAAGSAPKRKAAVASESAGKSVPAPNVDATGRTEPKYDVLYKQTLNAEDVYLGVDFTKSNASALSQGIVVKIQLPLVNSAKEIELEVEQFALILKTKDYYLKAHLPQKVVEKKAAAKWDVAQKTLAVTLTMDHDDHAIKVM